MHSKELAMNKIDKELVDPAVEPESEKAHRLTRAVISDIPVFGGTLAEAFSTLIEPPMERRKKKWMNKVTEAINELYRKKIITEKDLQENEQFFTALVHASSTAIKNHEEEKLDALRNAVLNSALPDAPDDTQQHLFLNLVDSCSSWHIALLKLFQNPAQWAEDNNHQFPNWSTGALNSVILSAYPTLKDYQAMYSLIFKQLCRDGLLGSDNLGTTMTGAGMLSKRTTRFGDEFIKFISPPN